MSDADCRAEVHRATATGSAIQRTDSAGDAN